MNNGLFGIGSGGDPATEVTNAELANMAQSTIKGRAVSAGTGDPTDLTAAQATAILDPFTDLLKGLVPASGGGTANFLRADATFAFASPGPTVVTAQATTSGTVIDFTSLPTFVSRIIVNFNGVSLNATDDILVQIGDSGGLGTTGYLGTSSFSGGSSTNATGGFPIRIQGAASAVSGQMFLTKVSTTEWVSSHNVRVASSAIVHGGGNKALATGPLDRVRITTIGGSTFDAGSVNIVYD